MSAPAMSLGGLLFSAAVPIVIAAAFVAAEWLARRVMTAIERGQAEAVPPVAPFGELPEPQIRAVMATRRRAVVVEINDLEGRN